jgi:hypothetical protein
MNLNHPSGGIASLLASQGRNGDSMLVHMTPGEVQGLQSLAMAAGGSLSINPETGLYEASFLKKLLPTLLGIGLSFIPGVGPLAAAGLVGAGETIRTGDLGKGLMAGLGAYGGAGIGSALGGVGSVAKAAAGTPGISQMTPEAFKSALSKEAVDAAAKKTITEGVSKAGLSSGIEALKTAPLTSLKAVGTQLGTAGVGSLGMTGASLLTPEMQMPKGNKDEDTLYYISEGYDPEKGFLGGQYVKNYPGLPGYAEGGEVDQQQDLRNYYQNLLSTPQQAPQQNAALQQYMADLNKFVATSGPTAPKTSPTYVAPPAPPPETKPTNPPPATKPPVTTPGGGFDGFDPNNFDWDALSQFGVDRQSVEDALRNFNMSGGMGATQDPGMANNAPMRGVANPFVEGYTPDFNNLDFTQLPGSGGGPLDIYRAIQNGPKTPDLGGMNQNTGPATGNLTGIEQFSEPAYSGMTGLGDNLAMSGMMDINSMNRGMQDYGMQDYDMMDYGIGADNGFAGGGQLGGYSDGGRMLRGPGDGMSDDIPAEIRSRKGRQPARLADGEFVVPADVVSHLGNGSSEAGSRKLYKMMDNIRRARTGKTRQAPQVKAEKYLPRKKK